MRILILAQFYPPIMGGIERHVRSLGSELAARGHQVAVATLWHRGQPQFETDGDVRVHRIRGTAQRITRLFTADRQHSPPFPDPEVTLALRRIVGEESPQIVHAHNWIIHSFLPLKSWSGARLVMTLHDCELTCVQMRMMQMDRQLCHGPELAKCLRCAWHHYGVAKGAVTLCGNWIMSRVERSSVDMFLPVSRAVADANRLTDGRTPFRVVPNFVPDDAVAARGEQVEGDQALAPLPPGGFILQVGDLTLDKGIQVLLDAYAGLPSAPPLVLVGRRFPESPGRLPPGVIVLEGLPHSGVMQAWRRSLFGTVASTCIDACPTVTLEAMVSGRAVVGSRIGGITDQIVDGETGFLVPPGDALALQQAMARLIGDAALRERMGEAARNRVVDFQAGSVVSAIEDVYRHVLRGGRTADAVRAVGSTAEPS